MKLDIFFSNSLCIIRQLCITTSAVSVAHKRVFYDILVSGADWVASNQNLSYALLDTHAANV